MNNKKNGIISYTLVYAFMFILTFILCVLLVTYYIEQRLCSKCEISSFLIGDINDVSYCIEGYGTNDDGDLLINGWFLKEGISYDYYNYGNDNHSQSVYNNMHIAFVNDEEVYLVPTKLIKREDVNLIIDDGIDYKYSGFTSKLSSTDKYIADEGKLVMVWEDINGIKEIYYLE